ncbi:MAG TPA: hypothetical protein VK988_18215 [Acidimicrobiales bacterium]|nr:hypothetical protein [Acidimicrobiales bacterium]
MVEAVLSAVRGSASAPETVTVLVTVPGRRNTIVMGIFILESLFRLPGRQVMVGPVTLQLRCERVGLKMTPEGTASITTGKSDDADLSITASDDRDVPGDGRPAIGEGCSGADSSGPPPRDVQGAWPQEGEVSVDRLSPRPVW